MLNFKGNFTATLTAFALLFQLFGLPLHAASVSVSVEVGANEVYNLEDSKENGSRALYQADPDEGSNSMFNVDTYTGVITFLTPATWQEGSNNSYTVSVTAGNGNSATDYDVVIEVNEPPLSVITIEDIIVANPQIGAYVTIPIRLSSGDEDVGGVSFSLSFDHDVFEFEELTKSDPASGMILVVNDSSKESGEIGAALGGFGTVIPAGDQVILEMELKVISLGSLGVKEIKFTDVPVATEVVTGSIASFVNEIVHGSVKLNSAPVAVIDNAITDEDTTLTSTVDLDANDTDLDGDALSVVGGTFTSNKGGTIIVSSDGSYIYTPAANFHGTETFDYTVTDGTLSDTGTLSITINSVNDSPVVNNDDYSMNEDTVLTVSATEGLLFNDDIGGDGGDLKAILTSSPLDGSLNLEENGSFTYEPNENYYGSDTFTYSITDSDGDTNTATVAITVISVDDTPVAANDAYIVDEDTTLTVVAANGVLANDSIGGDGGTLAATKATDPSNGTLTMNADGSFDYVPNPDSNGVDSFTYTITDTDGTTSTATVTITVDSVDDSPVANDDDFSMNEDTVLTVSVSEGLLPNDDIGGDGGDLKAILKSPPLNGTLNLSENGSFTYEANENYHGSDTFTYSILDSDGDESTATVSILVNQVEDEAIGTLAFVGEVQEGGELTAGTSDISDADGNLTFAYQWQSSSNNIAWSDIGGATALTYTIASDQSMVDQYIRLTAVSTDSLEGTTSHESTGSQISNVDDEATGTLAFVGDIEEGGTLTAVTSDISDADGNLTFAYQWQSSSDNSAWSDIGGATGNVYTIADNQSMVDQYIRLTAVSTDSLDGTTSHTSTGSQISNVNDPPVSETVRVELSEEDATAYGGTDVSASEGLLSMASDPDDPDDKSFTIESVSLAQIASESDDSLLVGTFKTQLDAVINIYEDGSFLYDASNLDFIKELDKWQSIEDSVEFQIIDESGGKSKLVNAIITINGNAYEGDINNDLSVDILDFQMAGQYLVGLTTIPDDSIMAAVDCYPINEGGNDRFNISDWVQVGRFALGLDAIKTKAFVGEQVYVAGKQTPLNASGQSTGVSQPVRRMQPLNFVQGGATQLGFVSSSDSASAGDSMDFSLVLKNAAEVSGLSFTMKFDPDELLISEGAIELSDEAKAEGFGVMLNANQANAGLMGVLIYAQPGELLGLSNAPLLQLKAEVLANHAQKRAEMKIVDWPVKSMASSIANRKVPVELVVELPMIKPITNYDDWADVIQQPVGNVESVIDVSDPDGDADGDGISNQLEFVFASNPYEKSSIAAYSTDKGSKDGSSQILTISTAYMAERGLVDFTFKAVGSLGSLTKGNDSLKPLVNSSVVGGLVHESITLPLDGSMGFITYEIKVMP